MARSEEIRVRILDAALSLLEQGGRDAVSTRAVTSAVGVQAPTLYRIFGDKQGLLDAVAAHGFEKHLATWQGARPDADPIDALRQGWNMHIQWGVENPHLYSIAYGDARVGIPSTASNAIDTILRTLIEQAAHAGRVRLPVEQAVHMLRAIGTGVVFTLIAMPEDTRDPQLSERAREAALSSFLVETDAASAGGPAATAVRLKMELGGTTALDRNELALLGDWLDRLANHL